MFIEVTLIEFLKNLLSVCEKNTDIEIDYSCVKFNNTEKVTIDFFHDSNISTIEIVDKNSKFIFDFNDENEEETTDE